MPRLSPKSTTIAEAAYLMRQGHAGNLVIVDSVKGRQIPCGIVTDRDIVISVVAMKLDANVFTLGDLVITDLVTVTEQEGIFETIRKMKSHGIRRMPVVDEKGELAGIVSVDDMIELLGEELGGLGKLIAREQAKEARDRR